MGMKLKSGADLCGFQLTNFCIQGEASAPSDAALGRKYFHTNATDDVATGISLLHRERIYLGEGVWRATAYLDDIAAINEKLDLITGDTDTDTLINNLKDLEEFLKDFSETDKLKSLLDGKLDKSGGTITGNLLIGAENNIAYNYLRIWRNNKKIELASAGDTAILTFNGVGFSFNETQALWNSNTLIHSGNIGSQKVASANKLVSGTTNTLTASGTTLVDANGHQIYDTGSTWFAFGSTSAVGVYQGGSSVQLKTTKGYDTTTAVFVNNSGNVTIGASDLAGTSAKLYVDGKVIANSNVEVRAASNGNAGFSLLMNNDSLEGYLFSARGSESSKNLRLYYMPNSNDTFKQLVDFTPSGNVGIGTKSPAAKLDVNGDLKINGALTRTFQYAVDADQAGNLTFKTNVTEWMFNNSSGSTIVVVNGASNNVGIGVNNPAYKLDVNGAVRSKSIVINRASDNVPAYYISEGSTQSLEIRTAGGDVPIVFNTNHNGAGERMRIAGDGTVYIRGNLIVDGEVSAGGAGAEEDTGGSGSAEGVSEIFTPTSTSMAFDHNLGEDVIVQVYEKSGNVWNMVIVDTEITSATRVTLRFGKTETTQHKVVIMGV